MNINYFREARPLRAVRLVCSLRARVEGGQPEDLVLGELIPLSSLEAAPPVPAAPGRPAREGVEAEVGRRCYTPDLPPPSPNYANCT